MGKGRRELLTSGVKDFMLGATGKLWLKRKLGALFVRLEDRLFFIRFLKEKTRNGNVKALI